MLLLLSVVAPFESEVLGEPEESPAFVELESMGVSDEPEGSLGMIELAVTNLTASAEVDSELELETMTTFAVPEKVYVPRKFH
jgi:hypothetical protein